MSLTNKNDFFCFTVIILFFISTPVIASTVDDYDSRDAVTVSFESPGDENERETFEWQVHAFWDSRYVSEGRDNLSGNAIVSASAELNYKDITFIPWVADAINTDYSEFNLNIVYAKQLLENIELFIGYNHIKARESSLDFSDNEISLELTYFHEKRFQIIGTVYYSFDAEGAFSEVAIEKNYPIDNMFSMNLRSTLGYNAGYVIDGHDGINHGQLLASVSYMLMKEVEVSAYSAYNIAINRNVSRYAGDELLRDFFWAGVSASYQF